MNNPFYREATGTADRAIEFAVLVGRYVAAYLVISEARVHSMAWLGSGLVFFYASLALRADETHSELVFQAAILRRRNLDDACKQKGLTTAETNTALESFDAAFKNDERFNNIRDYGSLLLAISSFVALVFWR